MPLGITTLEQSILLLRERIALYSEYLMASITFATSIYRLEETNIRVTLLINIFHHVDIIFQALINPQKYATCSVAALLRSAGSHVLQSVTC